MITFAPEELGLRNFSKIESPVAVQNKHRKYMLRNPKTYTLLYVLYKLWVIQARKLSELNNLQYYIHTIAYIMNIYLRISCIFTIRLHIFTSALLWMKLNCLNVAHRDR